MRRLKLAVLYPSALTIHALSPLSVHTLRPREVMSLKHALALAAEEEPPEASVIWHTIPRHLVGVQLAHSDAHRIARTRLNLRSSRACPHRQCQMGLGRGRGSASGFVDTGLLCRRTHACSADTIACAPPLPCTRNPRNLQGGRGNHCHVGHNQLFGRIRRRHLASAHQPRARTPVPTTAPARKIPAAQTLHVWRDACCAALRGPTMPARGWRESTCGSAQRGATCRGRRFGSLACPPCTAAQEGWLPRALRTRRSGRWVSPAGTCGTCTASGSRAHSPPTRPPSPSCHYGPFCPPPLAWRRASLLAPSLCAAPRRLPDATRGGGAGPGRHVGVGHAAA